MAGIGGLGTMPLIAALSSVPLIEGDDKDSSVIVVPSLGSAHPTLQEPSSNQPTFFSDSLPPGIFRLGDQ